MSPKFKPVAGGSPTAESPERLFDELPATRGGVPSLWAHQADLLRAYHQGHVESPDVAVELPTGAGKTLPALLIAEWRRTSLGERVVYACPTTQLADQVHACAVRQGMNTVVLYGSHRQWDTSDTSLYESGSAVAVTTYSSIFNLKPAMATPQALLFDDAHAGEQYVASAWSVAVSRFDDPQTYDRLLSAIGAELSGIHLQSLQGSDPDFRTRIDVRLLPVGAARRRATDIDAVLSSLSGDASYRYSMIRSHLDRCLIYFGWSGFLVRPFIAPTHQHPPFVDPAQRIYISATLGDGGELERAFGRAPIRRLPIPPGWEQRASGRRFFLFPDLVKSTDTNSLVKATIQRAGKALVISPSKRQLSERLSQVTPSDCPVVDGTDVAATIGRFRKAMRGVLGLANRYDGIDLADDDCRVTVLDGLPAGEHLQERFLVGSIRAGRVLEERLRTRVMQGAGRSTRGLKDYSIVIVVGDDITRFLQKSEIISALRAEAQAEIRFGATNSDSTEADIAEIVKSFLTQDDDWQNGAEPMISEARREAQRALPPGTTELATSVKHEVKAWMYAWRGDFRSASASAIDASQTLTHPVLDSYRALWLYLASAWLQAYSDETGDAQTTTTARELLRRAHGAAKSTTWLRELAPLQRNEAEIQPIDARSAEAIAAHSMRKMDGAKWAKITAELLDGLSGTAAGPFEAALSTLGTLLGADARKPSGQGRADSAWWFGDIRCITLEAKSEKKAENAISIDDVRQANTHLTIEASDCGVEMPADSFSVIVSHRQLADPDGATVAADHLFMCTPAELENIAQALIQAWRTIRNTAMGTEGQQAAQAIHQILADHLVLPSTICERLIAVPVRN